MKRTLIKNIGMLACILPADKLRLCGQEMEHVETLHDAWLLVEDGKIKDFGSNGSFPYDSTDGFSACIDAQGGTVLPSFCDSHTHLVYADSREQEFVDKIQGLSYAEIARRGGGILNSADRLHDLSEDELYRQAMRRVNEIIYKGTGAIEIKSGYGLNTADELKMLRVIRRIRETSIRGPTGCLCGFDYQRDDSRGGPTRACRLHRRVLRRRLLHARRDGAHP